MILKLIKYIDATVIKLRNRRIGVTVLDPNKFLLTFTLRTDNLLPRATHVVVKDKIVETGVSVTYKSLVALYEAIEDELKKANRPKGGNVETTKLGNQSGDFGFENHYCEYFKESDHILVLNSDDTLTRVDREDIKNWHEL